MLGFCKYGVWSENSSPHEFAPVFLEKVKIRPGVFQLPPVFLPYRRTVQIQNPGVRQGQQEGGVGGDNQLTTAVPDKLRQHFRQLLLQGGGKAVFRLVQTVQGVVFQFGVKILQSGFPVAAEGQVLSGVLTDVLPSGNGFPSGLMHLAEPFVVVKARELVGRIVVHLPVVEFPFFRDLFGNLLVGGTHGQHVIKHIVAGDDPAAVGNPVPETFVVEAHFISAGRRIPVKQFPGVVGCDPVQLQPGGNQVQQRTFSGAIGTVQNGDLPEVNLFQPLFRKDPAGIQIVHVAEILSAVFQHFIGDEPFFISFRGQGEVCNIHGDSPEARINVLFCSIPQTVV